MTADEALGGRPSDVWSALVDGLLDTRDDPATARFDAELMAAVDAGGLSRRTAQRLRFWQRAAVHGADDHVRAVLPTVLHALAASRAAAEAAAARSAALLDAADLGSSEHAGAERPDEHDQSIPEDVGVPDAPEVPAAQPAHGADVGHPAPGSEHLTAPDLWRGGRPAPAAPSDRPQPVADQPATAAQQAEPSDPDLDDVRRASASVGQGPSTLEPPPTRLFVADLREAIPWTDHG